MGSGNRVEELETRIRELEATVTGLTDELLECKQRLDELEERGDTDRDTIERFSSSDESDSNNITESESMENTDPESDEIIVA
jgi:uncharacterized coiled-coil protein SlyX